MNIVTEVRSNGSKRVSYVNDEPSLTKQSFSDECDINVIMARYEKTGVLSSENPISPSYGDFTDVVDYDESLRIVMDADEAFMSLPAKVRARFQNDPSEVIEFVRDPANRSEAVALGLIAASDAAGNNSSLDVIVPTDTNS
jgi:phage internal scaffolding protein